MSQPRILIATPVYGSPATATVHASFTQSLLQVAGFGVSILHSRMMMNCDLVRARSRAARICLDGCYTHLLFWDSDVSGNALVCLDTMLKQHVDVIAAPYPRKRLPPSQTHTPPYVAMGFTLITSACLERMWDEYYDDLWFDDLVDGRPYRTVAMFQLMMSDRHLTEHRRGLLPEDYSFCERWLRLGGVVHLYDGPGAPLDHVGGHVYQLDREAVTT